MHSIDHVSYSEMYAVRPQDAVKYVNREDAGVFEEKPIYSDVISTLLKCQHVKLSSVMQNQKVRSHDNIIHSHSYVLTLLAQ